jgi:hypothetical protein
VFTKPITQKAHKACKIKDVFKTVQNTDQSKSILTSRGIQGCQTKSISKERSSLFQSNTKLNLIDSEYSCDTGEDSDFFVLTKTRNLK